MTLELKNNVHNNFRAPFIVFLVDQVLLHFGMGNRTSLQQH